MRFRQQPFWRWVFMLTYEYKNIKDWFIVLSIHNRKRPTVFRTYMAGYF
jgi:hypothetical protein